jgi:hypothetical protein
MQFIINEIVEVNYSLLNKVRAISDLKCDEWVKYIVKRKDIDSGYINFLIAFNQIRKI